MFAAVLLMGAEDADARLADGPSFAAGESSAVVLSPHRVTVAAMATPRQASMIGQVGTGPYAGGTLSGLFSRGGLLGGFAAGFLGSGLLGLLFGHGMFGELGTIPSYVGLICQLGLLALLCRLIWSRWRGGAADTSRLSTRQLADPYLRSHHDLHAGFEARPTLDKGLRGDAVADVPPSDHVKPD